MKCTKLTLKFEFSYDSESPFGVNLKWENPSIQQITDVRDYILKQFNQEIERLEK